MSHGYRSEASSTTWPTGRWLLNVNYRLRGVLGVAIGLVILVWPDTSLAAMVVIIGIYAIIDGVARRGT